MLDKPVKPGETIYLNSISVLNPKITKGKSSNFILSVTPATTGHVTDRMGKVTLEKLSNVAEFPGQVGEGSGLKCVGSEAFEGLE